MKNGLILFLLILTIGLRAEQLLEGNYKFIGKQQSTKLLSSSSCDNGDVNVIGMPSFGCRHKLNILEGNKIFFSVFTYFDTGNTYGSRSGDYLLDLISTGANKYEGKNKSIELNLTMLENGNVEIFVYNRIISVSSKGIFNRNECVIIKDHSKYFFEKDTVEIKNNNQIYYEKISILDGGVTTLNEFAIANDSIEVEVQPLFKETSLERRVKCLGLNYGGYKVTGDKVIFEDQTSWQKKIEVRELSDVDINTFEVLTHNFYDYYVINVNSITSYPGIYTDFAKDAKKIYYQGEIIEGVTSDDFEVIDLLYASTSKNVYFKNNIIEEADVATFSSLNGGYAQDQNHYYRNGAVCKKNKDIKKLLKNKQNR